MGTVRTMVTMSLDRSDLAEVVGIFETFITGVREKDQGVLTYNYFIDEDPLLIHVIEEYESSEAHLAHYKTIDMQSVGRLLELVKLSEPHYYGEPSAAELELLAGFGNVHYHRPLVGIDDAATV
jgi:quinol monooxygenase YgiN